MTRTHTRTRTDDGPTRTRFWATIAVVLLVLPLPLALGTGLLTGLSTLSGSEMLKAFLVHYLGWFVVDAASIGWLVWSSRKD